MPQSLLAFLAMMVATTASLTQMTQSMHVQQEMVRSELTIMANALALEAIEVDAVPLGFSEVSELDNVTRALDFTVKSIPRLKLDLLSGLREKEPTLIEEERDVPFQVKWDVRYVDSNGAASSAATDIREVVVRVYGGGYAQPLVEHRRLIGQ